MAEPIEMTCGLRTRMGPRNHVSDGVQISMETENFEEVKGAHYLW